ncbi:MAG: alpha/beta fold hydrolase [Planctomycetota bacterium]|jgi:pimeloyl-ACP methyl ester carboxylesterase/membrane protein DedA with SNARE-associated domain
MTNPTAPRPWSLRRRLFLGSLVVYLLVLLASHALRAMQPEQLPPLGAEQSSILLQAVTEGDPTESEVRVVFEDHGPREAPAVVLVHGSPGDVGAFRSLMPLLEDELRVIAVDLPGFGKSELTVPDYSSAAHADYLIQLFDRLEVQRPHLVGFSMGGAVVLEAAERLGGDVGSVTLLAAIGVQELELMGEYHLNHAVHGLQVAALWMALEGLPHFGALDGQFFGVPYARNFYDTDQRPLRGILESFEAPLLVIHSPDDPLVPIEAAREHARIVPQAELVEFEVEDSAIPIRGHLLPMMDAERVAPLLIDFVSRVERGEGRMRSDATLARVEAARLPFESVPLEGMGWIVAFFLIAAATLVSEDLTCIATGALVAQGRIDLAGGAFACFVGIYVGDLLLFLTGRLAGARALKVPPLSWMLDDEVVERAARWFDRRGLSAIFLTRFMPGTRLPTYFAAGSLRTNALLFAIYFAIAAGVWTPILVWISSLIGGNLQENVELFEQALPLGLLATVVIGLLIVKLVVPMATWRGRRRLLGSWLRKRHWEFWPPWVFYPPVVLYVLWRGLRSGSLTAFTACNPGIEHGGFIGESKSAILEALRSAGDAVPAWALIPEGDDRSARDRALDEFFATHVEPGAKVALKPDAGQRGSGVLITADREEARAYVHANDLPLIVQEFVAGREFGVFYARRPSETVGRVLSVTVKQPATVTGDGRRSLEELILADGRAVAMAETYLHRNRGRLGQVPQAGEVVRISDLGTHALGAVFTDGAELITPELEAATERLARSFDGFNFGRFDLIAPDEDALRAGEGLRIVELNGVTSEMTHVYDRRHSVVYGWRTLIGQWRLAFEIADEQRRRGVELDSTFVVLRELTRYRRRQRQHRK